MWADIAFICHHLCCYSASLHFNIIICLSWLLIASLNFKGVPLWDRNTTVLFNPIFFTRCTGIICQSKFTYKEALNAMGSNSLSRLGRNHRHRQRTKQKVSHIVDDPRSSNPHSLLPWLKQKLKMFAPINNENYNPALPTAS